MVAIVVKLVVGVEFGELADDAVAFYDEFMAFCVRDDPFAADDGDGAGAVVVYGDEVGELVRAIRRCEAAVDVFDVV